MVSLINNTIKHSHITYLYVQIEDNISVDIILVCEKVYDFIENNKG
jgi:hypothetical protein